MMNKIQFLNKLKDLLVNSSESEIEKTIRYYDEILSDLIEDGINEFDAVLRLGNIEDIVKEILSEKEYKKNNTNKNKENNYNSNNYKSNKDNLNNSSDKYSHINNQNNGPYNYKPKQKSHLNTVVIILLLIFGFPLWFPLIIVAFTLLFVAFILCIIPFIIIASIFSSPFNNSIGVVTFFGIRGGYIFDFGFAIVMLGIIILLIPSYKKMFEKTKQVIIDAINYIRNLIGGNI